LATSLNLVLVGLRLGLKNRQVGEKWVSDDCSYLCKGLYLIFYLFLCDSFWHCFVGEKNDYYTLFIVLWFFEFGIIILQS
jgi:hypothetical protein